MKQNLLCFFIASILIYLPTITLEAETYYTKPTPICESSSDTLSIDSLLTEDHLYEFTYSNFDLACRIITEMRARKKLPLHRLDIAEGDLYYNTEHYRRALKYYQRALQSDSVRLNDEELMEQYHRMISCYDGLNDDTNKAIYIKKLLEKAEQTQNQPMHSIALFNLGKMLYYQGNPSKGYLYINQAIELMEKTDYKYKHDNLYYNYHMLFIFLKKDHRYEEALKALDNLQKVIETPTEEGEPYIQDLAEKEEKILCAHRAVVLHRLGRTKEAEAFYHRWLEIAQTHNKDNYLIMPYLFDRQLYDDIIRINSAYEKYLQSKRDTISYRMTTTLRSLGNVYEAKGDFYQSSNYFYRLSIIIDSIKKREQQSAALELATVYEISEKEAQLQQQASELRERNISLICITLIVIGLGFGLWRTIKYNRIIRTKNKTMSHTISKQIAYKTQLQESRKEINRLKEQSVQLKKMITESSPETTACIAEGPLDVETTSNSSTTDEPSFTERNKNRRIFEQLETILMEQKPFLDRNFSRDDLMRLAGVGRNAINPLIMECTGINANNYINDLRLEHAIIMLKENSNYTLNYVAEESGIPNMSTFYRLFRDKYSMTPTEFRNGLDKTIPK